MTAPTSPQELTGAYVRQVREDNKLSRNDFIQLLGWPTQTRLGNIETKDSWKPGNKEAIWEVLRRLTSGELPTMMQPVDYADDGEVPLPAGTPVNPVGTAMHRALEDYERARREAGQEVLIHVDDVDWDDELAELLTVHVVDDVTATPVLDPLLEGFAGDGEVVEAADASFPRLDLEPVERVFTNSELQSWRRCRRQWWLAWYRRLSKVGDDRTGARATGDRIHRALAMWYVPSGQPQTDPRDALERVITEDWTYITKMAQETGMDELRLAELASKFAQATALERVMIEGYWEWLAETGADSELVVVGPEQVVAAYVDVPNDPTVGEDVPSEFAAQRRVALVGKLDVRMERRSDGVRLFDDHKTAKDLTTKLKTLHGDPQMLTYHVLEWLGSEEAERRCDGALYTMLRKVKRTAQAKPPFYDRVEVRHNEHELDSWRRELIGAMRDVMRAVEELEAGADHMEVAYRTWRDECSWDCDFFAICPMLNDGSRVEDAIKSIYIEGDPLRRYDSTEVAVAVGGRVTDEEPKE